MPINASVAKKSWNIGRNHAGRDFVVGDLHGCYSLLDALLLHVSFDKSKDRLISVGDLIDRGPDNIECVDLMYQPWFYTVIGNHELMLTETVRPTTDPFYVKRMWLSNGGSWSLSVSQADLEDIADGFNQLPYVIVFETAAGRFNVAHAEIVKRVNGYAVAASDTDIDDWTFDDNDLDSMVWGRTIIMSPASAASKYQSRELSPTFVGHSVLTNMVVRERQIYLDGGAVFGLRNHDHTDTFSMRLADATNNQLYTYNTETKSITSEEFIFSEI